MSNLEEPHAVLSAVTLLMGGGSLVLWCLWLGGGLRHLWRWQSGPRVPFGLVDLFSALLIMAAAEIAVSLLTPSSGEVSPSPVTAATLDPARYWRLALARTLGLVVWCGWIYVTRPRAARQALRVYARRFREDLVRGIVGFLLWVPPILMLQAWLASWIDYQHPTAEMLKQLRDFSQIAPVVVTTVLVAPLAEELLFRGILLGWFDRVLVERPGMHSLLMGSHRESVYVREGIRGSGFTRWGAVLASSFVFAVLHLGNGPEGQWFGPDLVPLFLLAIVLGWITRQTGRLTPAILIHAMLNGLTVTIIILVSQST